MLSDSLRECGVVGAGGAGFPAYVKAQSQVEYLIANGAECEPLIHKERMKHFPEPRRRTEWKSPPIPAAGA